ncbi:hypothetical protein [uncultured Methanoregula sp.]|uniref:hypothetical protein n=1 Tax=uncultured Methanoregula sp. TaxID=1005933 RepID=UPI002AAC28FB|nr:hypothetical protein [uncultured Methanoregula sp.]
MKPEDDPWLKTAHENADLLDRENQKLWSLANPIRNGLPVITKYQDFWNQAKHITALFKELKPLARSDRDLLWKRFNALCRDVKEKQKAEYGTLESRSEARADEIIKLAEQARLPSGTPASALHDLVERGQALKNAGDLLGKCKHEMIAKHKKACFDCIQEIRKTHDAAWEKVKAGKPRRQSKAESHVRENLEANRERYRKAVSALENFQIGRDHIRTFLASCKDPEKAAVANAKLAETEARIRDIGGGILKLEQWIADDEQRLK